MTRRKLTAVARASVHYYNSEDEISVFVAALQRLVADHALGATLRKCVAQGDNYHTEEQLLAEVSPGICACRAPQSVSALNQQHERQRKFTTCQPRNTDQGGDHVIQASAVEVFETRDQETPPSSLVGRAQCDWSWDH
eukprot:CAMPEP_0198369616 /NCGR_PEP_ID=MMETSP1450-20131203/156298_1 /TAXON_ID=753684 ORGANISM="Madagascaria erythrocladiodes, Strain CCMP3234" /NCGR_SAMPLE_ID=MMETSP1450 /ASSEMBLY_ACC=CAM_ASM_001115 /LENGTH=137 /DNA_ID=CAMNT_0044077139 /DNA_START=166 /DNA_END=579 /DNA_ORIENTATION=-